ncbi:DUF2163 domain-containing protein [Paracoccus sp. MBLB3053]|uniref:DUF2163 domain-containing protein n=1 Tax=Paracoccus aurantius TaxID=3073814 RepID=A0ABU2HLU5_9RHOB|nr:DUF2163 domain-containing protein [Paracoccus sp. MBLB3053]MDS9466013.1 DUF2163 domain-containing protein [Paracoccus sp. MBLB3053]
MISETVARAWAVTRRDGLVLGFTDHDQSMVFETISFRPENGLSASALVQSSGLAVDNSEATGALSDDAITEVDIMAGRWDGADVRLWDVDWTDPQRRHLIFRGSLGEISHEGGAFRAELRGLSVPLGRSFGRVFHPRCSANLGDAKCTFDLSRLGYTAEGKILQEREGQFFSISDISDSETGWFEHGSFIVVAGKATGLQGVIKFDRRDEGRSREVELWTALGQRPAIGDLVQLVAGCDKRMQTCRGKFVNSLNFRGFPHLPSEDWLLSPAVKR